MPARWGEERRGDRIDPLYPPSHLFTLIHLFVSVLTTMTCLAGVAVVFSGPGRTADDVISRDIPWFQRCSTVQYSVSPELVALSSLLSPPVSYHSLLAFTRIFHFALSLKALVLFLICTTCRHHHHFVSADMISSLFKPLMPLTPDFCSSSAPLSASVPDSVPQGSAE
jgi:hypothetical protein